MVEQDVEGSRGSILIVDDTPENLYLLNEMLGTRHYTVRAVSRGTLAIEAAQSTPPDLILLDVMMPEMDGYQVCQQLKADDCTRQIPVIFLSALQDTRDKVKAFQVGGIDYITKPFHMQEVLARVETHLTISRLQKEMEQKNAALEREVAERQRAQYELEVHNEELDAFAHTVAHDIKSPLTAIIGFAEILQAHYTKFTPEGIIEKLQAISRNGRKAVTITDALLMLARVHSMTDLPLEPLDMSSIVDEVLARLEGLIDGRRAEIVLPETWPVGLGYAPWVEEVWTNYISNAAKYGGEPPRIELGADSLTEGMLRFWVRDNGPGLGPEEQEQLFMPFTRLSQRKIEGHGLGLSIVQRIAQKLGGTAGVESQTGAGSLFYFTLPFSPPNS